MKLLLRPLALLAAGLAAFTPASAKPPAKGNAQPSATSPAPSATPNKPSLNPTAVWLLQQDGDRDAITLPLREVVHAIAGKSVLPFDSTDAADKAFIAHLGSVMDRVLPRINRPDSPAQTIRAGTLDEVVAQIEEDISSAYSPGQSVADAVSRHYPSFRLTGTNGRTYYLAVVLYAPGKREEAARAAWEDEAFRIDPAEVGHQVTADGCCLLIGIEYEKKPSGGRAFLNWDVTDVSGVPVHAAITFRADAADVYHPGAVLTDGRKGSD